MATATTSMEVTTYMSGGNFEYSIKKAEGGSDTIIFNGKNYSPEDSLSVVDVGAIAKDYVFVSVPELSATTITTHTDALGIFNFYFQNTLADTWLLRDDYSGEPWTGANKVLSDPINGHTDPRQNILYSTFYNNATSVNIIPE